MIVVFNYLQFNERLRIINNIFSIELFSIDKFKKITIILINNNKHKINVDNLTQIICFVFETYFVREITFVKKTFDLIIQEIYVNIELYEIIKIINAFIVNVNK